MEEVIMNYNKMILILIMIVLCCSIIGCVSAKDNSDLNTTNMEIKDNNYLSSDEIDKISSDDCCEDAVNESKIWYVNPDLNNPNQVQAPTVQPVINNASAGDTVILNGTFVHCHFTINKTLTIKATPNTSVGVCPHHNHPSNSSTYGVFYITPEANGTVLEGFSFTNDFFRIATVQQNPFAVLIDGASNIQLNNLFINWTGVKTNELDPQDYLFKAIIIKNAHNITLNNLFINNTENAVIVVNSTNITVVNSTIINSKTDGIFIGENSSQISITNNQLPSSLINTKLTGSDVSILAGNSGNLKFILNDEKGNAVSNKTVYVIIDGVSNIKSTDVNGYITFPFLFSSSTLHNVVVYFEGDEEYKSCLKQSKIIVNLRSTSLTVNKYSFKVKKSKKVKVTLKSSGKSISNKKITIVVNKKSYSAKTNSKGVATFNIKLTKKGTYKYIAKFSGDSMYKFISKSSKIFVKK